MDRAMRWRRALVALAVAAMGVVDLESALLSRPPERLMALRRLVPTAVLDTSRTFTLLAGALLLFTAWGLWRGKRRAFVMALFLSAVSVPVNLLKAIDFEEATVAAGLLFVLGVSADAFRVKSRSVSLGALRSAFLWSAFALLLYAVAGCWWLEALYGDNPSLGHAFAEAGYRLFGIGEASLVLRFDLHPHGVRVVRWFLSSLPLLGITLLSAAAVVALSPVTYRRRHRRDLDRASQLVRRHGVSTVSWFALEDDVDYFFSDNGNAVIAWRHESGTLLAIGDPIGPREEWRPLLADFAGYCREHDWNFAFFQATPEALPVYQSLGWRALHVGEDPVIRPDRFTLEGAAMGNVRRAARRLEQQGLEVRSFHPEDSPFDPSGDPERLYEPMRAISHEWLRAHPGGEKTFCMGRFDARHLRESWLLVAWNPAASRVEAFVTWAPVWGRRGWALDLMRRGTESPSGVMDFLVVQSARLARERGDAMLSLSLSPLAMVGEDEIAGAAPGTVAAAARQAGPEADRVRQFLKRRLARFYDFENLFRWKRKFSPEFEDRYVVYPDALALPQVALAIVRAQSPGGIASYFRPSRVGPEAPRDGAAGGSPEAPAA